MFDVDGKTSYATSQGTYVLPEMSFEEADNWEVRVSYGEDK
jgi:hypothetical protein